MLPSHPCVSRDLGAQSFHIILIRGEGALLGGGETVKAHVLHTARTGGVVKGIDSALLSGYPTPDVRVNLAQVAVDGQTVLEELLAVPQYIFRYVAEM